MAISIDDKYIRITENGYKVYDDAKLRSSEKACAVSQDEVGQAVESKLAKIQAELREALTREFPDDDVESNGMSLIAVASEDTKALYDRFDRLIEEYGVYCRLCADCSQETSTGLDLIQEIVPQVYDTIVCGVHTVRLGYEAQDAAERYAELKEIPQFRQAEDC